MRHRRAHAATLKIALTNPRSMEYTATRAGNDLGAARRGRRPPDGAHNAPSAGHARAGRWRGAGQDSHADADAVRRVYTAALRPRRGVLLPIAMSGRLRDRVCHAGTTTDANPGPGGRMHLERRSTGF